MGKRNENIITVLDVGSAKTLALAVETTKAGLRCRGHGIVPSAGTQRGVIVDLELAATSVSDAVGIAEKACGFPLESAVVGISGPHIRSFNSHAAIALGSRPRELTSADVKAVGDRAREIALPEGCEILHILQREFVVDDQDGVRHPIGMLGRELEARVHVITAAHSAVQNVVSALNRAGMHVEDTIYEALACSESVLRREERELGAAVIDIGADTADIVVVQKDAVIHSGVVSLGSINYTRDNEILEPRARELMELARDNLRQAGVFDMLGGGIVLTGGRAQLLSIRQSCAEILWHPVRIGFPIGMALLPVELQEPEYAAAIGMAFYTQRSRMLKSAEER